MTDRIRRLPRDLVNKIAAGEVVERPASVVKELVENSLDAGATRVEVTLEEGGRRLTRVSDDGAGMSAEDLKLAFEPHATSKIADAEDLFRIATLGFRGEALASIAAVSHCRTVSRERGAQAGAVIECDAGRLGEPRAIGAPEGTLIEARDLFFNVPARLKFLRANATELRHAAETVTRLALPHPEVAFQLTHNGKSVLKLEKAPGPRERLAALFGEDFAKTLLPVRSESSAMSVTGFASPPGAGETNSLQYVFLNGRYIRDRAIQRAMAEAYRSRIMRGKYPAVFLDLRLDPARVDVNVHPTKIEVRFRDPGAVFAQLLAAVESALRAAGPAAISREENVRNAMADFLARNAGQSAPPAPFLKSQPAPTRTGSLLPDVPPPTGAVIRVPPAANDHDNVAPAPPPATAVEETHQGEESPPRAAELHAATEPHTGAFFQIHNAYIIEETPDGFLVIDQHALHERILYEELRARAGHAAVPRQRLLVPDVVDLRPQDFLRAMEMKDALLRLGLEVEAFGERTVAIQAVPHLATGVNPRELLLDILREAVETPAGHPGDREERMMRTIACKAAVKAGAPLSRPQIEALLDRRNRLGPEPTCPHGRPTTLQFTLRDLLKQFKRV